MMCLLSGCSRPNKCLQLTLSSSRLCPPRSQFWGTLEFPHAEGRRGRNCLRGWGGWVGVRGGIVLPSTADLSGGCVRDPMGTSPGSGHALGVIIIIHSIIICLLLVAAVALPVASCSWCFPRSLFPPPCSDFETKPSHHHFHTKKHWNTPSLTPVWEKQQPRHHFQVLTIYK